MRRELRTVEPDRGGGGYVTLDAGGHGSFTGAAADVFAAMRDLIGDDQLAAGLVEQGWSNGYVYLGEIEDDAPTTSRSLTPEARDRADEDSDLDEDLTDDDAPGPDEEDHEDFDDETLAHIHALLDEEDDEYPEAQRADLSLGGERLHRYWTIGKGLRKWRGSPHPWTALYRHLRKYVGSERAKRMAAKWVKEVTGNWPGSDAHRVATGHKPRGNRIGPG